MKNVVLMIFIFCVTISTSFAQRFDYDELDISSFQDTIPKQLINELKNKRVILLGEQSHGDGATFDIKVKLIKEFHQKLGFNVIAFENGLYDCYKATQLADKNNYLKSSYRDAIFPFWYETTAFKELINYIDSVKDGENPITLCGFDNQEDYLFKEYYFEDLRKLFIKNNSYLNEKSYEIIKEVFFGEAEVITEGTIDSLRFSEAVQEVKKAFSKCSESEFKKVMEQSFDGYLKLIYTDIDRINGQKIYVQNPRDKAMADNLIFLTDLYVNKKIIGWGASYHFAYDLSNYENTSFTKQAGNDIKSQYKNVNDIDDFNLDSTMSNAVPMGDLVKSKLKEQLYSLSFTSFEGTFRNIMNDNTYKLPKTNDESLEFYLKQKEYNFAFVQLNSNKPEKFYSSVLGNLPIKASWCKAYDGILFIQKAYSPKQIVFNNDNEVTKFQNNSFSISGSITDQSGNPVPYVHVLIEGTSIGTVSNNMGDFKLNFKNENTNSKIQFTSIGFETTTLKLSELNLNKPISIILKEQSSYLDEITITTKRLDPYQIIKLTKQRINENYFQKPINQEYFYRVDKRINDTTYFNEEATVLTFLENGFKPSNKPYQDIYGKVLQFRNTTENLDDKKWEGIGSLWLVFTHDLILDKSNLLHRTSAYYLEISDIIVNSSGTEIYEISFECKRPSSYTTGFGYPAPKKSHGKIYINADNYAVLRYEHCIHRRDSEEKQIEIKNLTHQLIQTYSNYKGKYYLNYSKQIEMFEYFDLTKKTSYKCTYNYDLLITELNVEKPTVLRKPIIKLTNEELPPTNEDFWNSHNYSISDKIFNIECEE